MASFDENGKYIKTNWKAGDKITATKLNKIEESIEAVNDNDISRHVEADTRLDALEAKDVAHDKELTNIKNTIADNKAAAELGDYDINSRMQFLEDELEEAVAEVNNVASTVDGKIAQAEANMTAQVNTAKGEMTAQVNRGKADMEAMVAEVESEMNELQNDVTEIQNDVTEIQNDVTEIQNDVTEIQNDVTELQEQSQNANAFMTQFEVSHVNKNGYYVLPGGLTLQWGIMSVYFDDASSKIGEHTFNVPFKNDVYALFIDTNGFGADANGEAASVDMYSIAYYYTVNSFKYEIKTISGSTPSGTVHFSWFAIGM